MELLDFLVHEAFITDLQATTKEEAIREDGCLIDRLRLCQTREEIVDVLANLDADFPDARANMA